MYQRSTKHLRVLFTSLMVAGMLFTSLGNLAVPVYAQDVSTETPIVTPADTAAPTDVAPTATEAPTLVPSETEAPTDEPTLTETPTPTEIVLPTEAVTEEPTAASTPAIESVNPYFSKQNVTMSDGTILTRKIISGPSTPPWGLSAESISVINPDTASSKMLTVPAYQWEFGCSSVSGSMIAGYYDRNGYSNLYTGSTNGGLMPLVEDSSWGTWTDSNGDTYPNNPLIASHNGLDGRTTKGSIDDYWVYYLSGLNDPYITNSWSQHTWETVGDYMMTSQSAYGNDDGSTSFWNYDSGEKLPCATLQDAGAPYSYDGSIGREQFYEAKGYTVTDCYNQEVDSKYSGGFSLANYRAEIDAGNPVMINLTGHTIVGVGYQPGTSTIYVHDTWDNNTHSMTWGSYYINSSLLMDSVSIIHLSPVAPSLIAPSGDISTETPTYQWNVVGGATSYMLTVTNTDTNAVLFSKSIAASVCSGGVCSTKPTNKLIGQDYKFEVAAINAGGQSGVNSMTFRDVNHMLPTLAPTLVAPSVVIYVPKPVFQWNAVAGATGYVITAVNADTSAVMIDHKAVSASACKSSLCSYTSPVVFPDAPNYYFRVAATNAYGTGPASTGMYFSVAYQQAPFAQADIGPTGTNYLAKPIYTWNAATGSAATGYYFSLTNRDTSVVLINSAVVKASACKSGVCSYTPTAKNMTDNIYEFKVIPFNTFGNGAENTQSFYYAYHTAPMKPVVLGPTGTNYLAKPTYTWNAAGGSATTGYHVTLINTDTATTLLSQAVVSPSACKSGLCSYTPTVKNMLDGNYSFSVSAYNTFGESDAAQTTFAYAYHTAPAAFTITAPTGTIDDINPTFTWTNPAVGSAVATYNVVLTNSDTSIVVLNTTVKATVCVSSNCTYTSLVAAANGNYSLTITANNAFGSTPETQTFTIFGIDSQFTKNANGWKTNFGSWSVTGGTYKTTTASMATFNNGSFTDYDVSARMKRTGGDKYMYVAGYGYGWWAPNTLLSVPGYDFHFIQWPNDGNTYSYYVCPWSDTNCYVSSANTATYAVNDWNTLRVIANGSDHRFYLNGAIIWEDSTSAGTSGPVSVSGGKIAGTTTSVSVDWVVLGPYIAANVPAGASAGISKLQKFDPKKGLQTSKGLILFEGDDAILIPNK